MIKLYTKNNCVQCKKSKELMDKLGIEYDTINLEDDPEAVELVKTFGFKSAPVIITDNDSWAGFSPDRIRRLKQDEQKNQEKES